VKSDYFNRQAQVLAELALSIARKLDGAPGPSAAGLAKELRQTLDRLETICPAATPESVSERIAASRKARHAAMREKSEADITTN